LSAEDEARADRLLRDNVCISLHEHGGLLPLELAETDVYIRRAPVDDGPRDDGGRHRTGA
jgi:hypothetical protein